MAYLGVTPKIGNIRKLDDVAAQFNGVATVFNLRVGGQVIFPGSPLQSHLTWWCDAGSKCFLSN